ncbi:tyrosine-type recombinase/integrase [Olsenella sp. oral taxon 807]|uniref:tyrosine-type recombinase/integrase n=1 Tax=Olsenella sp. oral taxon 807 TaxID=712411 RepID=UPI00155DB9B9
MALCEEGGALGSSFAPHVLGRDEVARVFRAARASAAGERAHSRYAAMCLCHACGLRRSEAGNLRVSDFDPGARAVAAGHSKSDVSRLVAMSESTAEVLAEHAAMPRDPAPGAFLLRGRHAGRVALPVLARLPRCRGRGPPRRRQPPAPARPPAHVLRPRAGEDRGGRPRHTRRAAPPRRLPRPQGHRRDGALPAPRRAGVPRGVRRGGRWLAGLLREGEPWARAGGTSGTTPSASWATT